MTVLPRVARSVPGLLLAGGLVSGCASWRMEVSPEPRLAVETACEFSRDPKPEGLSDITPAGGDRYWCVNDRGGRLHEFEIALDETGAVTRCHAVRSVKLQGRLDLEGCARDPLDGRIWVSDEGDASVRQFDPETGAETACVAIPDVFGKYAVGNRSFEALAIAPDGRALYVANEDTLKCDGPVSDKTRGGLVRIQEFVRGGTNDPWRAARQFRYRTERVLGEPYRGLEISGVVALAAADDGALYVLEREMSRKNPLFPSFQAGLFEVRPAGADGAVLEKRMLWSADTLFANYEGMCFGPRLKDGARTLILVSDGGGPAVETVRVLVLRYVDPGTRSLREHPREQ